MRRIFANVPAIYGFSALAPLGPTAGALLERYLESAPPGGIGSGRPSQALLARFAGHAMFVVGGLGPDDPQAAYRSEVCRFVDDRSSPADRLRVVHDLLQGEMAEVRMFLDRIEGVYASLRDDERRMPPVVQAQDAIARDHAARDRVVRFAEDADMPATRARMIRLAGQIGWLSPADERAESVRMVGDLIGNRALDRADIARTLARYRLKSADGKDVIDVLIRRLGMQ